MAKVRIPFCATAELQKPFILDESYSDPNGVKSILFDKSALKVTTRQQVVDVPDIGPVKICVYYIVGSIPYICNAFPVIQDVGYDSHEQSAIFNDQTGNTAADSAATVTSTALGWISASGSVNVEASVGGACSIDETPSVESVTVENLAVANNVTTALTPSIPEGTGEEEKRVVKWRGWFVITTA